jgi:hypothetical protein
MSFEYKDIWKKIKITASTPWEIKNDLFVKQPDSTKPGYFKPMPSYLLLGKYMKSVAVSNLIFTLIVLLSSSILVILLARASIRYDIFKEIVRIKFMKEMFLLTIILLNVYDFCFVIVSIALCQDSLMHITPTQKSYSFILKLLWGMSRKKHLPSGKFKKI